MKRFVVIKSRKIKILSVLDKEMDDEKGELVNPVIDKMK